MYLTACYKFFMILHGSLSDEIAKMTIDKPPQRLKGPGSQLILARTQNIVLISLQKIIDMEDTMSWPGMQQCIHGNDPRKRKCAKCSHVLHVLGDLSTDCTCRSTIGM